LERQRLYLLSLAFLMLVPTPWLYAIGGITLDEYISVYVIAYFATSAVFRPRRRIFDFVGLGLFIIFCVIVAMRVLVILSQ
jgi:hypothetical protein